MQRCELCLLPTVLISHNSSPLASTLMVKHSICSDLLRLGSYTPVC